PPPPENRTLASGYNFETRTVSLTRLARPERISTRSLATSLRNSLATRLSIPNPPSKMIPPTRSVSVGCSTGNPVSKGRNNSDPRTFTKATISKTKKRPDNKARTTKPRLLKGFDFLLRRSSRCLPVIITQTNFGGHCSVPEGQGWDPVLGHYQSHDHPF